MSPALAVCGPWAEGPKNPVVMGGTGVLVAVLAGELVAVGGINVLVGVSTGTLVAVGGADVFVGVAVGVSVGMLTGVLVGVLSCRGVEVGVAVETGRPAA